MIPIEIIDKIRKLFILQNYNEVIKVCKNSIKVYPNEGILYNFAGVSYQALKNFPISITYLNKAVNIDPQNISYLNNLANSYTSLRRYESAENIYKQALSIDEKKQYNISLKPIGKIQRIEKNIEIASKKNIKNEINFDINKQEESVSNLVTLWSKSWEEKKLDKYFKCYLNNYKAKNYSKHSEWKKDREQRIKNKKNIKIEITNFNVIILNEKNSLIEFQQDYKSESFNDKVTKHLILIRHADGWKIAGEYIVR